MIKKLSIIIPAFNEEKTIHKVLEIIGSLELVHHIEKEIIVVNDFSSDNTAALIEGFQSSNPNINLKLFNREVNRGKGAAIHYGIKEATGDFLIPQDADLELDPNDINKLLEKAIDEQLDVVYGSRFKNGNQGKEGLGLWANLFLTRLSNTFTGFRISDMETCYKLIRTSIAKSLTLKEERFGFEPEITAKLAKIPKLKIDEVSISYQVRSYDEGKKIGWKDGLKAIYCIVKYSF
ncbi:MAG: glycosyltransferase family 2 protein [Bacteroidetes bacterium]|nr:MAG: glycosyltransferase family 2 protein [Bacteroidota bacterium]MBL1144913.1 glycosyltransferase family 2 protein [Bacteroidota bacterium]MCB0803413.1 glycosyltransferase family 2 protein [Flavobacteriales bacterium]NOG57707.1 glycosyltransferase family 2 protein [Bacteroidota bacterium]